MDQEKIKRGVRLILEGIGEDPTREGLIGTPDRIARMCEEIFSGTDQAAYDALSVTFPCENQGLILEKDIPFYSMCEHHLLPFYGKVHIAYLSKNQVAGLSKLARTVEAFARRAQIQEQMTMQIADAIMNMMDTKGVMVVVEAEHLCMNMRGVKKPGTKTMTYVCRGEFEQSDCLVDRVLRMIE